MLQFNGENPWIHPLNGWKLEEWSFHGYNCQDQFGLWKKGKSAGKHAHV
jgi:hypothetical protein